jgi:hypothetical protein
MALSRHPRLRRIRPLSGGKQTCPGADVCFRGRYWEYSGHALLHCICLLVTQSGHATKYGL